LLLQRSIFYYKNKSKEKIMLYYVFFFILSCATQALFATIPPAEFDAMIATLKKIDLNTATDAEYEQFMALSATIDIEGDLTQKNYVNALLNEELPKENEQLKAVASIIESDIVTPEVWQKKVMGVLKDIDEHGSAEEKSSLHIFMREHKEKIAAHCKKLIESLYYDSEVKEALKFIIVNTVMGILPSLGLKSLSILAGNLPLAMATAQLTDLSVLSALDSIVRYSLQKQPEFLSAPLAAGVSTAIQGFIGFVGPRPANFSILGFTAKTTDIATLQAATIAFAKNNLVNQNNMVNILNNLDWQELAVGSEQQLVTTKPEELTFMGYLQNALIPVLQNQTVRSVTATTLSYAIEGALLAAALNIVGLGFYGTSTSAALVAGMTRGALEGLFLHASQKTTRPGIVQRVSTGFGVLSIQKYITTGIMGTAVTDLVPLVTQQVLAGAVDGIVHKTGGWKKFVTGLFAR
jgi:hypothetical protein